MIHASGQSIPPITQLFRWAVWGGLATFTFVSLLLVVQRFAASSTRPLDPVTTVVLVAVVAMLALLLRLPQGRGAVGNSGVERWGIILLPGVCLILLGIAVSSPEMSWTVFILVWLLIVAEEGYQWWRARANLRWPWRWPARDSTRVDRRRQSHSGTQQAIPQAYGQSTGEMPTNATQSMLRTRDAGSEAITGTLRADFRAGERTVYAHVGFCPPLAGTPRIEVEQTDGPEATIKLAQVLPHGARFDVRLQRASDEAVRVELAFHAVTKEPRRHEGRKID